jgi:hypothetical protein
MKKGCAYCTDMHLRRCPDAFTERAPMCGKYDNSEMPQVSGKRKYTIYAVDFDGTLCVSKFPEIGAPNMALINHLIKRRAKGNKVILWTCRVDKRLEEAVEWCKKFGLEFDVVNANLPEIIAYWGNESRKVFADVYIDDKAVNKPCYHVPYEEEL